jgi:hypothetical protein
MPVFIFLYCQWSNNIRGSIDGSSGAYWIKIFITNGDERRGNKYICKYSVVIYSQTCVQH